MEFHRQTLKQRDALIANWEQKKGGTARIDKRENLMRMDNLSATLISQIMGAPQITQTHISTDTCRTPQEEVCNALKRLNLLISPRLQESLMTQRSPRFDIPTQVGDRFIDLADILPAVHPDGLLWEMADAWVVTKEGSPDDVRRILDLAEHATIQVPWDKIEECSRWASQCNDLTLRGYADATKNNMSIEIVAFDSQAWEVTVNDSSRFDETKLIPLGGRWMWVDELGQTLEPMNNE